MFSELLLAQVQEEIADFIASQDAARPHWHIKVSKYRDQNLPRRCVVRSTDQNMRMNWIIVLM
jgi:hypothetical protein